MCLTYDLNKTAQVIIFFGLFASQRIYQFTVEPGMCPSLCSVMLGQMEVDMIPAFLGLNGQ